MYINGSSPRSDAAIYNLRKICDAVVPEQYDLSIIDLQEHPSLITEKDIIVAPTLDKEFPPPACRIVGDLSNHDRVLSILGISETGARFVGTKRS